MKRISLSKVLVLLAGTCAAVIAIPAYTSAQILSVEKSLIDAFVNNCVLNLPNLEKIRAASRLFGWKSLSQDAKIMLGPIDSGALFEGWMAGDMTIRYVIGISTGSIGPQRVATCTVANPDVKQHDLLESIRKKLDLKFLSDETEAGQRYRSWTTAVNGYSVLIALTTMQDQHTTGGSLAASVKLQ